jgi:hypothetical protein
MGYIIAVVIVLLLLPLLFVILGRRSTGRGGITTRGRGLTMSEPSADQPTPGRGGNESAPGTERRIPPG